VPFDAVLIYNLKPPQITCANYAIRRFGLPVILDYEDDAFRGVWGNSGTNLTSRYYASAAKRLLGRASGCIGVSPFLLSQTRTSIPKLLLRGIVSDPIVALSQARNGARNNWVVFSGTHERSQGVEQMIKAWRMLEKAGWELHIAGKGAITKTLHDLAENDPTIVFHGLLSRKENADLVCKAKIGMNPQDPPSEPGTVFAFKIIEYLAAGLHVITTPRGELEKELEAGITYIPDNSPEAIAQGLRAAIEDRSYERRAQQAALLTYGPNAVEASLNKLFEQVMAARC
jgi:glycosyltransferase involved in cell wall biosynthesis